MTGIIISDKYTATEMNFKWRDDPPLSFPSDFGDGYRLPKYVVTFTAETDMHIIFYGEGKINSHIINQLIFLLTQLVNFPILYTRSFK